MNAGKTVLLYARDLIFASRIQDVVERLGGRVQVVEDAASLAEGLGEVPALAVVEMGAAEQEDWIAAIHYARKWTRGVPIIAFGPHVNVAAREAARRAQCDYVWSKSRFVREFPALAARYLQPGDHIRGCDEPLPELVREGLALFNRGEYYQCHDALEAAWFAESRDCRDLYQGILQLAIALHHIQQENFTGADKVLRRAINKFQRLPARCQGVNVAHLHALARDLRNRLLELGPERIDEFPRDLFPKIEAQPAGPYGPGTR
ncbi:MAG: DUF309 domain-containing protein [Chloroflexi bacterium]|nr:DUF309 domain-containing protein [Chloroflexota bacterium]